MRYGLMRKAGADGRAATTIGALGGPAMLCAALAAALAAGCASQPLHSGSSPSTALSSAPAARAPSPSPSEAPGSPRVITNLSQLSSSETDQAALNTAAKVLKTDPAKDEAAAVARGLGQDSPSTLRRLYLESPESPRYAETMIPHTQIRLLNAKAAEFPGFSNMMLTQVLNEMIKEEHQEPLVTLELSEQTKPVVLSAILSDKGQLRELIYLQHSGLAAIDNFVIEACKQSLWANNMPAGALSKDGDYRLRIEAQLSKYSADRDGNQTFTTRLGLGIL